MSEFFRFDVCDGFLFSLDLYIILYVCIIRLSSFPLSHTLCTCLVYLIQMGNDRIYGLPVMNICEMYIDITFVMPFLCRIDYKPVILNFKYILLNIYCIVCGGKKSILPYVVLSKYNYS